MSRRRGRAARDPVERAEERRAAHHARPDHYCRRHRKQLYRSMRAVAAAAIDWSTIEGRPYRPYECVVNGRAAGWHLTTRPINRGPA